jgi:hypothetical protein
MEGEGMTDVIRCARWSGLVAGLLAAVGLSAGEPASQVTSPKLDIGFRNNPDPPRAGPNAIEVTLKLADGKTVDDAQVTVVYYMPAMPSMSMPEMKTSVTLRPAGNGIYRGNGSLAMGGTWNVTIAAKQAGKSLGSRKLSVVAK